METCKTGKENSQIRMKVFMFVESFDFPENQLMRWRLNGNTFAE